MHIASSRLEHLLVSSPLCFRNRSWRFVTFGPHLCDSDRKFLRCLPLCVQDNKSSPMCVRVSSACPCVLCVSVCPLRVRVSSVCPCVLCVRVSSVCPCVLCVSALRVRVQCLYQIRQATVLHMIFAMVQNRQRTVKFVLKT